MQLTAGARLGVYEIVAPLGAGGMGEVYRARDPRLGREVAIKVLSSDINADPAMLQRFQQEARAAASLNHPGIMSVHDIGAHEGCPFIVSELLEGETLREELASGPLPPVRALEYAQQIAQALAAAHDRGVVHRDLKPENIFITKDRRAKILDFGLARLIEAPLRAADETGATTAGSPTAAGQVLGTAGYMSPEQVRGEPADHRADLFSFGAVLYEMLAGRRAFAGRTAIEAMSAVLRDEPQDLSSLPNIAAPLVRVVRRCLEKRPDDRFQSARDLGFALTEAANPAPAADASAVARKRMPSIGAVATFAAVVALGVLAYWRFDTAAPPVVPRIGALAVLPLRNVSNDPGQAYFADGMTEALISSLGRFGGVRVTSRTSAMAFPPGGKLLLPDIAKLLKVDAVVEGSVARVADRVRITVQLVHAATDTTLWSNSYDRDLRDVLSLQADVSREIAREIKITLTPQEQQRLAAMPPINAEAHEQYMRGRYFLAKGTEESINRAIRAFTDATVLDSQYARPHAGLADAYTMLRSTYLPPHTVMPKAKAAAARALELDPDLAEAHVSMGGVLMFYDFDWAGAERELTRAIELSPNLADAHDYHALYLAAVGRSDEAKAATVRARELDPLSLPILVDAGWVHYLARDYETALAIDRKALDIDPNYWPALRDAGLAYEKTGRFEEAVAALEKARALDPNPSVLEMLGGAYAAWGKTAKAREILQQMTLRASQQYICPFEIATVHAGLGDKKETLQWLERGYAERADCMPWARADPKLDALRGSPEFEDLIRRIGLPRSSRETPAAPR